jgi:Probable zinc-ribbon domain
METKIITCIQCEREFEFTPGEQKYFKDKGFDDPKRCSACRRNKSRENQEKTRSKDKKWQLHWNKYESKGERYS